MRYSIVAVGIALVVFIFIAGCTSDSARGPEIPGTTPPQSVQTAVPSTEVITIPVTTTIVPTTITTPDPLGDSPDLVTIDTITGGSGSRSANVTVSSGYWEMWYTADPLVTGGQDSHSASGSQSAVFPSLSVVVSDANGKEIATVEPPGGLDVNLWQRSGDPRPWSKKFYEGNKEYTFDITARSVKSYLVEVRVRKP